MKKKISIPPPAKIRKNGQITGNVGLYFCCYELSRMGWNVMPTARNARGVDIIAYNSDASRFVGLQVKALSKRSAVPLGGTLKKCLGNYWIIINKLETSSPNVYVLTPSEVKKGARLAGEGKKAAWWLEPKKYELPRFKNAWKRIGLGA
jgi:hypothetical protein